VGWGLLIIEESQPHLDALNSVGILFVNDQPELKDLYLTTHDTHKIDIHAPAGFEPAIPANERPQTHALDRAATRNERHMYAAYYTATLIEVLITSYPMTLMAIVLVMYNAHNRISLPHVRLFAATQRCSTKHHHLF
jgi:hypothetical protein